MSLKCSSLYLSQFRFTSSHLLANGDGIKNATIVGDVYIHPSAKVHPTAKVVPLFCDYMFMMFCPCLQLHSSVTLDLSFLVSHFFLKLLKCVTFVHRLVPMYLFQQMFV